MSNIGSIGSGGGMATQYAMSMNRRDCRPPDTRAMAEDLFSRLDTANQGYIDQHGLQTALEGTGLGSNTDASKLFSALDGDGDGKLTKSEFSDGLKALEDQMRNQRMDELRASMPPPPPPDGGGDAPAFTKDELSSMAGNLADVDSQRADLFKQLADNFDAADGDGDGRISREEAMAFQSPTQQGAGSDTRTQSLDSTLLQQITALMRTYGHSPDQDSHSLSLTA